MSLGPSHITLWDSREQAQENADTLATAVTVNNEVHCLGPMSPMPSNSIHETGG